MSNDNVVDLAEEKRKRNETESKIQMLEMFLASGPMRNQIFGREGELRFNELSEKVELGGKELRLENSSLFGYRVALSKSSERQMGGCFEVGNESMLDAVCHRAEQFSYHPIEDWVRAQVWDGEDRLGGGLPAAFGVTPGTIQATFIRLTMRAMVARATRPGCQVDTVLVLVGGQGNKKSRSLEALAGVGWFSDPHMDFDNKDSWEQVHRFLMLEFAELSAIRKGDVESVKAFITRATDSYRDPYGRKSKVRLRRSIFVGTTNNLDFLTDPTGNRRWWPVEIGDKEIDKAWIESNRTQIFAQAFHEISAGAIWWLTEEEEKLHSVVAQKHMAIDAWRDPIFKWIHSNLDKGEKGCETNEIIELAIGKKPENINSGDSRHASHLLRLLGATSHTRDGVLVWKW